MALDTIPYIYTFKRGRGVGSLFFRDLTTPRVFFFLNLDAKKTFFLLHFLPFCDENIYTRSSNVARILFLMATLLLFSFFISMSRKQEGGKKKIIIQAYLPAQGWG